MPQYEVPIYYSGLLNYIVEADSPEMARQLATDRFYRAEPPEDLGNEYERIDVVGKIKAVEGDLSA